MTKNILTKKTTNTGNHTRNTHDNIDRRQGKPNQKKKESDVFEQIFIYK